MMWWIIFEYVATGVQNFILLHFLSLFVGCRHTGKRKIMEFGAVWLVSCIAAVICNYFYVFTYLEILLIVIIYAVYGWICLERNRLLLLFGIAIDNIMLGSCSVGISFLLSSFLRTDVSSLFGEAGIARALFIILVNLLLFYCSKIILRFRQNRTKLAMPEFLLLIVNPLFSVIVLLALTKIFLAQPIQIISTPYIIISLLGILLGNISTYYLFVRMSKANEVRLQYALLQQLYEFKYSNIEEIIHLYEESHQIRHDMKNYLSVVWAYLDKNQIEEAKNFLLDLQDKRLKGGNSVIFSKNDVLNYILNAKKKRCEQLGIACFFVVMTDPVNIPAVDLSILIGNLLDNAIEGSQHYEQPRIDLTMKSNNNLLELEIRNTIPESVLDKNPSLKTTKGDKSRHGHGIPSVKRILESYQGVIDFFEEDKQFCCRVTLYFLQ